MFVLKVYSMKELRWLREEPKSHAFFFLFFFFFLSCVDCFRCKKLRAALAMEETKPINQNKEQKKPEIVIAPRRPKVLRPKPLAYHSESETKYTEITTLKLLLI